MKAVRVDAHGGLDALLCRDVPDPPCRPDHVIVKVRACAVNHLDLWVRDGIPGARFQLPRILGTDIAGEVVDAGALCSRVRPGSRIVLSPVLSCRQCEHCVAGRDYLCERFTLFGTGVDGGYAEYVAAPEYAVVPCPADMTFEEAAAAPLSFLTAWHMLITRAQLRPAERVLVLGAAGGIGSAAVQIAKLVSCTVIGTVGNDSKAAAARALGCDHVIDHSVQDIYKEVRRLTEARGVDVVFEHVGQATWAASLGSLARHGRLVTCGATTGSSVQLDLRYMFTRHVSVIGSSIGGLGELHDVLKLLFRRRLKSLVDRTYPLHEVRAAQQRLERREQCGKIVLLPT